MYFLLLLLLYFFYCPTCLLIVQIKKEKEFSKVNILLHPDVSKAPCVRT